MLQKILGVIFFVLAVVTLIGARVIYTQGEKPPEQRAWWYNILPDPGERYRKKRRARATRQQRSRRLSRFGIKCTQKNGRQKCGLINNVTGRLSPQHYDHIFPAYKDKIARVLVDGHYGLIDIQGNYLLKPRLEWITPVSETKGHMLGLSKGQIYKISLNGQIDQESSPIGTHYHKVWEGIFAVEREGSWGLFLLNGTEVLPAQYDEIDKAPVPSTGKTDKRNRSMRRLRLFFGGLPVRLRKGNKWGYVYARQKQILSISPVFDEAEPFSKGFAVAKLNGRYGLLGPTVNWAIAPRFEHKFEIISVQRGRLPSILIKYQGRAALLLVDNRATGHFLIPPLYDEIACPGSRYVIPVRKGDKWGLVTSFGRPITEVVYDEISCFAAQACFTKARKDGRPVYLSRLGKEVGAEIIQLGGTIFMNRCVKALDQKARTLPENQKINRFGRNDKWGLAQ